MYSANESFQFKSKSFFFLFSFSSVRVLADNPNARRGAVLSQLVEDELDGYKRPNTVSSYSIAEFSL